MIEATTDLSRVARGTQLTSRAKTEKYAHTHTYIYIPFITHILPKMETL